MEKQGDSAMFGPYLLATYMPAQHQRYRVHHDPVVCSPACTLARFESCHTMRKAPCLGWSKVCIAFDALDLRMSDDTEFF